MLQADEVVATLRLHGLGWGAKALGALGKSAPRSETV